MGLTVQRQMARKYQTTDKTRKKLPTSYIKISRDLPTNDKGRNFNRQSNEILADNRQVDPTNSVSRVTKLHTRLFILALAIMDLSAQELSIALRRNLKRLRLMSVIFFCRYWKTAQTELELICAAVELGAKRFCSVCLILKRGTIV